MVAHYAGIVALRERTRPLPDIMVEDVLVDRNSGKILALNASGAAIWELLDASRTARRRGLPRRRTGLKDAAPCGINEDRRGRAPITSSSG
jgi:hypothetical protein